MDTVVRVGAAGVRWERQVSEGRRVSVLFVCLGNICRSPTAEGVMRALVREAGMEQRIELDSAGTGGWHVGESPDARATDAARRRGIALEGAARKVRPRDFEEFDLILAMDAANLRDLQRLAPDERARGKVRLLREWGRAGSQASDGELDVPDPYYGGPEGFDRVLDLVHASCAALLEQLLAETGMLAETGTRARGECLPASVKGESSPAAAADAEAAPAQ
jgi:protein-tyrosine phosphatase